MAKTTSIDELTGLPSRPEFLRKAETSIPWSALSTPVSIVLLDIDQFQILSDRMGREPADAGIRDIAALFKSMPGDGSVVCRHGVDSFLCVLPGATKSAAIIFAEKLRAAVEGFRSGFTISAGVATAPKDGAGLQPLIRAARLVLSEAKSRGRNRVFAVGQ